MDSEKNIDSFFFFRPQGSNRRRTITSANSTVPTFMKDIYLSLLNDAGDQGEIKNLTFQNLDSLQGSQFQLQDKNIQVNIFEILDLICDIFNFNGKIHSFKFQILITQNLISQLPKEFNNLMAGSISFIYLII